MKARRRHELKENVLAHELGEVKNFLSKYGNWVLAAITAVLIVVLVVWYYHRRSQAESINERNRYEQLTQQAELGLEERLAGLIELAENAKSPINGASAAVFAGNLCLQRYLDLQDESAAQESREWLRKAEEHFRLAIQKYPELNPMVARAHFGLGTVAENEGDMETAEAEYEQARRLVSPADALAGDAEYRLSRLKAWSKPVKFATTTQATQPAATAPAETRPATTGPAAGTPTTRPAAAALPE
jgi:tetratricopeptide (TPR) repeat protein